MSTNLDIHDVIEVRIEDQREHSDFCSRSIVITDKSGNVVEINLYTRSEDENALRIVV